MFKNLMYRIQGLKKIEEKNDRIVFECEKCTNHLPVQKNYGKLHVVCKCGHSFNIYTGRNTHKLQEIKNEIPKELKVFDYKITEYNKRLVIRGRFINQSIYFLKDPFGVFDVGQTGKEVLFFPSLHIENSNTAKTIEPFEEGEFLHYISKEEVNSINGLKSQELKIQFIEFDRTQKRNT